MPSIFRIFENGRYKTSVKKQAVTAAFAPVAAAVVCSSPVVVVQRRRREQSNGDERDEGLRRGGRFAEEAASKHSERLRSKFQ
jgi:hypothetical protein